MKKQVSILLWLIWIPWAADAQQELNRYLEIAAENNPGLRASFNEYMAALEVVPQAGSLPDPQVAFGYFISPVETRVGPQRLKIGASQMFPWFGTLNSRENVATQSARVKYASFLEAKARLFNQVRSNFYDLYFNRSAIQLTRENLEILESFRELVRIRVEGGAVSAVDQYRVKMQIADMENQLALLLDKQQVLEVMFRNLLHSEEETEILVPEVLWDLDIGLTKAQALDSIRQNNHQLRSIDLQKEVLASREELAGKMGKPGFSVGLDYTMIGKGDQDLAGRDAFLFPKIGITIPLYRNKYKAMVREVVLLRQATQNEASDRTNLLENLLEEAWKDYVDSDRRIDLYRKQQELASRALKLLETEYATGSEEFEEILRMERKLLNYGLELEKARSDKQAAISFIHYLMGK